MANHLFKYLVENAKEAKTTSVTYPQFAEITTGANLLDDYFDYKSLIKMVDFDKIVEVAAETGYIKPEDKERLIKFRNNPSDESWIGGSNA